MGSQRLMWDRINHGVVLVYPSSHEEVVGQFYEMSGDYCLLMQRVGNMRVEIWEIGMQDSSFLVVVYQNGSSANHDPSIASYDDCWQAMGMVDDIAQAYAAGNPRVLLDLLGGIQWQGAAADQNPRQVPYA